MPKRGAASLKLAQGKKRKASPSDDSTAPVKAKNLAPCTPGTVEEDHEHPALKNAPPIAATFQVADTGTFKAASAPTVEGPDRERDIVMTSNSPDKRIDGDSFPREGINSPSPILRQASIRERDIRLVRKKGVTTAADPEHVSGSLSKHRNAANKDLKRSLKDFYMCQVLVNVADIEEPEILVRPLPRNSEAVFAFETIFRSNRYGEGDRLISIALTGESSASTENLVDKVSAAANKGDFYSLVPSPGVRYVVADGMHRLEALRRAGEPKQILAWFFLHKNGHALSLADAQFIGFRQNMMDLEGRKITTMDRVYS